MHFHYLEEYHMGGVVTSVMVSSMEVVLAFLLEDDDGDEVVEMEEGESLVVSGFDSVGLIILSKE